jgi:hypothetical protein
MGRAGFEPATLGLKVLPLFRLEHNTLAYPAGHDLPPRTAWLSQFARTHYPTAPVVVRSVVRLNSRVESGDEAPSPVASSGAGR